MLKVTITSATCREMKGVGKTSGKPYHMAMQTAWIHTFDRDGTPSPFPEKIELNLDKDDQGQFQIYPVGEYHLHPSSVYVAHDGGLSVAPRLVRAKQA